MQIKTGNTFLFSWWFIMQEEENEHFIAHVMLIRLIIIELTVLCFNYILITDYETFHSTSYFHSIIILKNIT